MKETASCHSLPAALAGCTQLAPLAMVAAAVRFLPAHLACLAMLDDNGWDPPHSMHVLRMVFRNADQQGQLPAVYCQRGHEDLPAVFTHCTGPGGGH